MNNGASKTTIASDAVNPMMPAHFTETTWREEADAALTRYTTKSMAEHLAPMFTERLLETEPTIEDLSSLFATTDSKAMNAAIVTMIESCLEDDQVAALGLIEIIDTQWNVAHSLGRCSRFHSLEEQASRQSCAVDVEEERIELISYYNQLAQDGRVRKWSFSEWDDNATYFSGDVLSTLFAEEEDDQADLLAELRARLNSAQPSQ
jgi:hypothetical protein